MIDILAAMNDPHLFRPWFRKRDTWRVWRIFLAALFALPMNDEQLAIYQECTGRASPPTEPPTEAWLIAGRRGGKSFILALTAVYIACFRDYRQFLAPGERATIMIIARDRSQARIVLRYVGALLQVPLLKQMVERDAAATFDLNNSVTIEVATAGFKGTRGYAVAAVVADEVAFWPSDDSAAPDFEIINALKPGMAQFPNALLLCASSPYARRGALWSAWQKHFGKPGPVLVWQASTRAMNPTIPQSVVDEAMERDPSWAAAEYLAEFRTDIEGYIAREVLEACVSRGVFERPPVPGLRYIAFVDPSGGSADSYTLAIAHRDGDSLILDALREAKPPFSPESVTREFAATLKTYRISKTTGDRYAGEWPREQFRKHGINYLLSTRPKSDIYRDLLPLLNSRRVDLLDNNKLISQLTNLERRTARGGRDSIDHPPGAHDDIGNAAAGVLTLSLAPTSSLKYGALSSGPNSPGVDLDPRTGRPLNGSERARVRWIVVPEAAVGAVRGITEREEKRHG